MARFRRLEVLNAIVESGLVPVFYHPDGDVAFEVARACARGGSRVVEFTHRGDLAHRVFEDLSARAAAELPDLILGAGSIGDPQTAALYVAAGANFVVGPILHPEVARFCNRRKVPYSPGCGSATEIAAAEELGAEIIKIFPGDAAGGPAFVKAILGPSPWTSIMPTGGVEATPEGLRAWFDAGVVAVGMGSKLVTREVIRERAWDRLAASVADVLGWIRDARR